MIDSQAPAYAFETGKSFLRAFKLPAGGPSFELRLYSQAGSSVLAPNAMLLDSRMRPTRLLDADDFVYVPPTGLKGDSLDARLRIDRSQPEHPGNERYLILYTSEAQMAGQTVLQHPAKAYAKALGNEPPSIPDPVAQHSPVGVIKLVMIPDSAAGSTAKGYVPGYSIGRDGQRTAYRAGTDGAAGNLGLLSPGDRCGAGAKDRTRPAPGRRSRARRRYPCEAASAAANRDSLTQSAATGGWVKCHPPCDGSRLGFSAAEWNPQDDRPCLRRSISAPLAPPAAAPRSATAPARRFRRR